jgi:succinate dehydrogenase / fumarate reductase cytochrome b subunit
MVGSELPKSGSSARDDIVRFFDNHWGESMVPSFFKSSLGRKYAMGVTGLLLLCFVLGHMAGNLLIFQGPEALNGYAEFLHEAGHGMLVWVARLGLLTIFGIHLILAFILKGENKKARPIAYHTDTALVSNWASRHMMLSGIVILLFVIYHIAHFTLGLTDISSSYRVRLEGSARPNLLDVYAMVIKGFQNLFVSAFYIVCQVILAAHLWHGASSWFQSVGLNRSKWRSCTSLVGPIIAVVVIVGNCSIPLSVLLGLGKNYEVQKYEQMEARYGIKPVTVGAAGKESATRTGGPSKGSLEREDSASPSKVPSTKKGDAPAKGEDKAPGSKSGKEKSGATGDIAAPPSVPEKGPGAAKSESPKK